MSGICEDTLREAFALIQRHRLSLEVHPNPTRKDRLVIYVAHKPSGYAASCYDAPLERLPEIVRGCANAITRTREGFKLS